jgi:predicted molibdopterin-dependent oxidoreductase YjgC
MVGAPHHPLHLPLCGTNVAVLTALAHMVVTEGLVDEAFVRERCDWSEPRNGPLVAPVSEQPGYAIMTGVDPKDLREAARQSPAAMARPLRLGSPNTVVGSTTVTRSPTPQWRPAISAPASA